MKVGVISEEAGHSQRNFSFALTRNKNKTSFQNFSQNVPCLTVWNMDDKFYVCTVFEIRHGTKRWYWQIPLYWWTKRYGTQHGWLGFPKNHRSSFVAAAIDVTRTGASSKSVIGDKLISSRAPDFCNLLIFPISHRPEPTISDIKGGCIKHCSL